jgi:hypothetical protein
VRGEGEESSKATRALFNHVTSHARRVASKARVEQ